MIFFRLFIYLFIVWSSSLACRFSGGLPQFMKQFISPLPNQRKAFDSTKHSNWRFANPEICGTSLTDRIVGGVNASLGEYPWLARIGYVPRVKQNKKIVHRCSGALINNDYVVTAAHCVVDIPAKLNIETIELGEYNTKTEIDCVDDECADPLQIFHWKHIIVHGDYGKPIYRNDIALIRLDQSAEYSKWVRPICLPHGPLMTSNLQDEMVEVAGWGYNVIGVPKGSVILQTVKLPITTNDQCQRAFRSISVSPANQLCVGGEIGKDSCTGDSGGPLMKVENIDGQPRYYLVGIVSFGARFCGLSTSPAIYTKISSYMNWVLSNMRD